jgi:phosphate transport system substrate-binding protein
MPFSAGERRTAENKTPSAEATDSPQARERPPASETSGTVATNTFRGDEPQQESTPLGGFARAPQRTQGTQETTKSSQARAGRPLIRLIGPPIALPFAEKVAGSSLPMTLESESVDNDEAFRRLCKDVDGAPTVVLTTRRITQDELKGCERLRDDWVTERHRQYLAVVEAKLGYLGVVISAAKTASAIGFSPRDLYLSLAKEIPDPANPTQFIPNPNVSWHQVHPGYEERTITIFGPAADSRLAKTLAVLVMEEGCNTFPSIKALKNADPDRYRSLCHEIREDAAYVAVYESEFFLTQTLWADPNAIAVLSVPFFDQHRNKLAGSLLNGPEPTTQSIASSAYPGSAAVYLYSSKDRMEQVHGLWSFVDEFLSERAIGPRGYLVAEGLIPLDEAERPARARQLDQIDELAR